MYLAPKASKRAASVACGVDSVFIGLRLVGSLVLLVACIFVIAKVRLRRTIRAKVRRGTDGATLKAMPNATVVRASTNDGKRDVQKYVVTTGDGTVTCTASQDPRKPFPVSADGHRVQCQSKYWNPARLEVEYDGKTYTVTDDHLATTVDEAIGTYRSYYHDEDTDTLSAVCLPCVARTIATVLSPCMLLATAWTGVRMRLVTDPKICNYDMSEHVPSTCSAFATAYNDGLEFAKAKSVASHTAEVGKELGGVVGDAVAFVGNAGTGINTFNGIQADSMAGFRLWKCASGGSDAADKSFGVYVLMRVAVALVPSALVGYVVYDLVRAKTSRTTDNTPVAIIVAVIAGAIVALIASRTQIGLWRQKLGLSFIDWPRVAF